MMAGQCSRGAIVALGVSVLCATCFAVPDLRDDQVMMEIALEGDDQCLSDSSAVDCALQALQLKVGKTFEVEKTEANDISVTFFEKANVSLLALQPHILKVWSALQVQNGVVERTMEEMKNATGRRVVWNAGYKAPPPSGRRRRRSVGKHLPKRTKYIMHLVVAVQKEMAQFWKTYALVDRKRIGILNDLTIYRYGPSHPALVEEGATALDEDESLDEEGQVSLDDENSDEDESVDDDGADDVPDDDDDKPKTNKDMITNSFESMILEIKDAQNKTANLTSHIDTAVSRVKVWMTKR